MINYAKVFELRERDDEEDKYCPNCGHPVEEGRARETRGEINYPERLGFDE